MSPIIKKILIFVVILLLVLGGYYFFFLKNKTPVPETSLVSTTANAPISTAPTNTTPTASNTYMTEDLLALLLNVRNIKIDDALFGTPAFTSLNDSTIELIQEGNEGRVNPFAPIGVDPVVISTSPVDTGIPSIPDQNTIQVSETPAQGISPAGPSALDVLNTTTTNTKTPSTTKSTTTSGIKITPNN